MNVDPLSPAWVPPVDDEPVARHLSAVPRLAELLPAPRQDLDGHTTRQLLLAELRALADG